MTVQKHEKQDFGDSFLEPIIDWIVSYYDPEYLYGWKRFEDVVRNGCAPTDIWTIEELKEDIALYEKDE